MGEGVSGSHPGAKFHRYLAEALSKRFSPNLAHRHKVTHIDDVINRPKFLVDRFTDFDFADG